MGTPIRYCGFLRGINVGGHALIKMPELKRVFESAGLENVRTLLASGNVVFETARSDKKTLANIIEKELKKVLGKDTPVTLRSLPELQKIRSAGPFKTVRVTPAVRLYVTFLSKEVQPRTITIPFASDHDEFRILKVAQGEVFSVVDLSKGRGTPEAMNILEKEFGADVTTRNWNTVLKILELMEKV
jgi:uncharacterized protein (DUF1697 family)